MPPPTTTNEFLELVRNSGVAEPRRLDAWLGQLGTTGPTPEQPVQIATLLVREGLLTPFQARQFLKGRWRGLVLGKYVILEQLGSGGMGVVYLAEHRFMRRRVALKVLPLVLAQDPWFLEQFYREAQAIAALDHPHIVRAHDIDHEGNLHFLVMEYVDGRNLHEIVQTHGPLSVERAANYISQAAWGLQHAFEAGLVHRDIKPGNLLLDRQGTVKVLDMGLACFARERTRSAQAAQGKGDEKRTLGTDDFLAPEQIVNSDDVDIRADIYSLGAAFYFLLTRQPPFPDTTLAWQKLVAHLTRRPKPIRQLRAEVPEKLAAVIEKMMAKNPWERYQTPAAVVEALAPWTPAPIPPPPPQEMPSPLLSGQRATTGGLSSAASLLAGSAKRTWVVARPGSGAVPGSGLLPESSKVQGEIPTATGSTTDRVGGAAPDKGPKGAGPDK
jgi:serine/threonine protein kinase